MQVLEFGNRPASWVALAVFSAIFCMLANAAWRKIRKRVPERRRTATVVGNLIFIVPVTLIYASSLNGFYEAEVRDDRLMLRYLFPAESEIPIADIEMVRAAPAFKGRWRLHLVVVNGVRYESATADRDVVNEAAERLRRTVQSSR
jgi:hypothetical protein